MPRGQPVTVPGGGLTTRQRRDRPLLIVRTGDGGGKPTAASGLAPRGRSQGRNIAVFRFAKSAKRCAGGQAVMESPGNLHDETRRREYPEAGPRGRVPGQIPSSAPIAARPPELAGRLLPAAGQVRHPRSRP